MSSVKSAGVFAVGMIGGMVIAFILFSGITLIAIVFGALISALGG